MSNYDFETVVFREGVGSGKWDEIKHTLGYTPKGIIPFSVADMEFVTQPEVVDGLKHFLDTSCPGLCAANGKLQNGCKGVDEETP